MAAPPSPWLVAADLLDPQVDPYAADPVGYSRDILGFHAWSKQREIMESVRDHPRTAVRSCHGVGKTASAAQIAIWFLATHPQSRVITTAPTWAQVVDMLWRDIREAVGRAHVAGRALTLPEPSVNKLELDAKWFAVGWSTDKPERFQGHHADHLLLVVDEASGVDERIYEAAEGFLTAEGAKVLLIGNPTMIGGQFHRAFTTERATWNQIHISVTDSPNYTGEQVPAEVARALPRREWYEEKARDWGIDSPMFQVRVMGNFAATAEDTVVPLGGVEAAQQRYRDGQPRDSTMERVVIGCDVARFGNDETVITERVGQRIRIAEHYTGKPTTHTAARVVALANSHPRPHVRVVIDDTGVGGGVTDQVRAAGHSVTGYNAGATAHRPLKFPNRRSELWFEMAAQLEDLELDADDQLAADLTAPRYSYDMKMRHVVEGKDATKKRLGRSPDRADAVMLTLVSAGHEGAVAAAPAEQARSPWEPSPASEQDLYKPRI